MRKLGPFLLVAALSVAACSGGRAKYPYADAGLDLSSVVLYRNGVGYFERQGRVDGDVLRIKVRKDHVNDLLKSLTVVKRDGGQAVSVSMPLDPQSWANAALATLAPGRGSLAEVLDVLRGTRVTLHMERGTLSGRILMVEVVEGAIAEPAQRGRDSEPSPTTDHKITLLDDDSMRVVLLSKVKGITLEDGDLAMQFHRSLDATAGEGMFQQVEVAVRLTGASSHDVVVSYVSPAPMWKPTYRVVLPEKGKGKALLQGWAVVDNTSGEDWRDVRLSLTSGAPIAFRYDLHTPRDVERSDLTESGVSKRARVAVGETTYERDEPPPEEVAEAEDDSGVEERRAEKAGEIALMDMPTGAAGAGRPSSRTARGPVGDKKNKDEGGRYDNAPSAPPPPPPEPAVAFESLRQSTLAQARASAVSGLTRFDLVTPVTVPDGSSTMVAIINQGVDAEETFLFKPGGAGMGYEANPYRVVRFRNSTPFVLEPGPISIYAGGSFVGEGLSEAVGAGTSATIPFAVEPGIMVTSSVERTGDEMRLLRIVRGVLEVESFARTATTWNVKSQSLKDGYTVLIRHSKAGTHYALVDRPKETEDLMNAYLIPIKVPAGKREGEIKVVEQTPSRMQLTIWDSRSVKLLDTLLVSGGLNPADRAKLEPIVKLRQEIGRMDTEIEGLREQRDSLDQRASETRRSLQAIAKDNAAGALRQKLNKRLEEFTAQADKAGREMVELQSKRLEKKIELEDLLQNFDLRAK
jgi:hypothetical protein